ncbi:MAG TPA: STAS domain-containing protein [Solirubrobacteraceae bacterium]
MKLADVQFSDHERVVVARLTGEVDLSNAESIEAAISEAMPNQALALILDVSALGYLDSAGIHLIYKLREKLRARGQALRLVIPPNSPANDALRLAGVSRNVETAESLQAAMAEFLTESAGAEGSTPEGHTAEGPAAEGPTAEVPDQGSV